MPSVGFHASHELYSPSKLLQWTELVSKSTFSDCMCSDHFHPWSESGNGGNAWTWLGSAMALTQMSFGTVCAVGQRYHPAIIAQMAATLQEMFPNRFWLAIGTGENLNEHITGSPWPMKPIRRQRLIESVDVMRRLWAGEVVSYRGHVVVEKAKLYSIPSIPPKIFGAAISDETAEWVGDWADGLLTVGKPLEQLNKTVQAFRRGGGEGKPMRLQAAVSYSSSEESATSEAFNNWGFATLPPEDHQDVALPEEFDARIRGTDPCKIHESLRVSSSLEEHVRWLHDDFSAGFETVFLHNVGGNMESFIRTFSQQVIPKALNSF